MKSLEESQKTSCQEIEESLIFCPQGFKALKICSNPKCENYGFMCEQETCQCHLDHKRCLKIYKQSFKQSLQNKLVTYKMIQEKIKTQIQKSIDFLSNIEENLLKQLKQKQSQLIGLNEYQKLVFKSLNQGQHWLTGNYVYTSLRDLQKPKKIIEITNIFNQDINKNWEQFLKQINTFEQKMKFTIQNFGFDYFKDSNVIKNTKQEKNINNFFKTQSQEIKSVQLLYRASENQFSAQKFHKLCDGKTDTITICQNTFGKKFGGFTPLAWKSNNQSCNDNTGKSFVFSLSNNDKFINQMKMESIICNKNWGPVFGGSTADIAITDKCHVNSTSFCNPNQSYKNPDYNQSDQESQILMTSVQDGCKFIVRDYQVWKVNFVE